MNYGLCLEMFFTNRPFLERIGLCAEAGYRFGEMWFTDGTFDGHDINSGDTKDPDQVRAAAQEAGITLTNATIGSPDGAIGGGLTRPSRRNDWLNRTDATLKFCKEAGIPAAIVCTGNIVPGKTHAAMRQSVLDGLKATVERAEKANIDLFLEPLNDRVDHPGYFCTHSDDGAELCRAVNSPRLKMLFDCYHMQVMEGDITAHIEKNLDVIAHFHCAGVPGRHEPYNCEVNYAHIVQRVEELGFKGVFGFEYLPLLEDKLSLRKTLSYLSDDTTPQFAS